MTVTSNDYSFGTLLQNLRRRRGRTQQQLAEALGVHRRTLVRWEQGDFLPQSKALVLELARHLKLDEQETRQLLEASLTALAPHWSVPYPRNSYFTGREAILSALHRQLGVEQAVALTRSVALQGLGGVGKTQIALEYAYRYALDYRAVFWIGAETQEQIVASFQRVAAMLGLPERDDKDQQRVVTAVQRWLTTHGQWLLIWDNVEDLELLHWFLPATREGALLLTTRLQALGTLARGIDLLPMEQEEGMLFLLRRAKVLDPQAGRQHMRQLAAQRPQPYAAAEDLVTILGGLPLALDQAGAYVEETQCGLSTYLDLFHTRRADLLRQRGEGSRDHPTSVSTTLTLSIEATTRRHPTVEELLRVCALLQADAIPEELFRQGGEHLGTPLVLACRDPLEWDRLVGVACSYSLLSRQPEEQTLSIHRLVQAVLLDAMTEEEREQWSVRVIAALEMALPDVWRASKYDAWKQCERLLPHALLRVQRAGVTSESFPLACLAHKMACYLLRRGRYAQAVPLSQRALSIREHVLGPEHPDVASSLNNLAILSMNQGQFAEAEPLFRRALHIREQALGPEHPDVASSLNNLAVLFRDQGKYTEMEPLYQRALQIWEQVLGPEHPETAVPLNNLADLYWKQGKYRQAEPLARRVLHIREHVLGPEHPDVADPLYISANLFREQGEYAQAEPLYQRALHIQEQTLGPEHPKVATSLTDLAECYRMQRRDAQAEPLYQRALHIQEQTLGPEHPDVASPLNGLANLSRDQSHYAEAERHYQRALSLREQHLGLHHPDVAETLHDLALLRQKQGNLSEAFSLAERALSIRSQALGELHPRTVASRKLSAHLAQEKIDTGGETASLHRPEAIADPRGNERHEDGASSSLHQTVIPASYKNDPLQEFLDACCDLHPRAWCRSADLWQTYQEWAQNRHKRYPISRAAFTEQLKAHGCRTDRTKTARIWRGIALVRMNDDGE